MFSASHKVPHLTVEDLFCAPVRTAASISPDGTRIACLAPWRGTLNVWVESVDTHEEARCLTADDNRGVHAYHWTDDPRWLLYEQDDDGDENRHVFRIDLENPDREAADLTPFPGVRATGFETTPSRPGKALLHLNHRERTEFDFYELDIATGELTMLAQNPGRAGGWLYTPGGDLYAHGLTDDGDIELSRWDAERDTWHLVVTFDGSDYPLGIQPFQVTPDGTGVWIGSSRGSDRTRLVRLDLATGKETEVDDHLVLGLDPRHAVSPSLPPPLILDRRTGELAGVRYLGERQVIRALDPHFAAVLENLEKLSDGDLAVVSGDENGQRWVVSFTHDRDPGVTFFYDHSTGESRLLFRPYPHLGPGALAPKTPLTVYSRDGLALPAYLTLPVGADPAGLPLVLLVREGPWHRDTWGFDPFEQLLANRGYAVLQVNLRGSSGFGKAFTEAGTGEPAGTRHDDLVDAVDWVVARGYADRERVAVLGGSYGGDATLPENNTDMYRAVDFLARHLCGKPEDQAGDISVHMQLKHPSGKVSPGGKDC
ncbi:prolyl oligopeptidase family serine peptidase [Streptomyces sp. NBC_01808]|uniref:S9 family peptidase n=1 Tax=Streptomyces sp. NBC_01808 TaxID=2975947 RepID=UPI002DD89D12|nr:prolyl oligopeptidase family serine peptidase [Streptomyces sp. NBC_01808]WSA40286.1 prolyl oligopeptidase family serine peptidase [Streptomyces sp. NBC_01808]